LSTAPIIKVKGAGDKSLTVIIACLSLSTDSACLLFDGIHQKVLQFLSGVSSNFKANLLRAPAGAFCGTVPMLYAITCVSYPLKNALKLTHFLFNKIKCFLKTDAGQRRETIWPIIIC